MLCVFIIYWKYRRENRLSGPQHQRSRDITRCVTWHKTCCMYIHTYTHFWKELCPTTAVQQKQHVDMVGCGTSLGGWSACLSLMFCELQVGASRFVERALHPSSTPWLGGVVKFSQRCCCVLQSPVILCRVCVETNCRVCVETNYRLFEESSVSRKVAT